MRGTDSAGPHCARLVDDEELSGAHSMTPIYFHGGAPGLGKKELLRSKESASSALSPAMVAAHYQPRGTAKDYSESHVYFTTDLDLARAFANSFGSSQGWVYRVRPIGPVEIDTDFPGGISFRAPLAEITRVENDRVSMTLEEQTRIFGPIQIWHGGGRYFDEKGIVQPSIPMERAGWTPAALELLPAWTPLERLGHELTRLALAQTAEIVKRAPGIGSAGNAERHATVGLSQKAIAALGVEQYGSVAAWQSAIAALRA
ncbi:hypothetical protein ACEXQE_13180 [Herbiconiux sp. P17]|uniref:hypothetical protein n=1 Tax=Herbiconiux wuyangfengii TaxID=3342794 RepID=UPI0035B84172